MNKKYIFLVSNVQIYIISINVTCKIAIKIILLLKYFLDIPCYIASDIKTCFTIKCGEI